MIDTMPEIENASLPKELADITAIRQRLERAWRARLQTCTTMISNIDSILANFKEEVEIEEIVAFKTILRQAIANFAAEDSSSSPPLIPSHTQLSKGNGYSNHKDKDMNLKKVLVATPYIVPTPVLNRKKTQETALPKNPPTKNNTWVTVARNGHKKARVVRQSPTNKTATSGADKRLFVRVPREHEWRKLSPAGIREVLVRKLSISPTLIGRIKPVHSGFALSPCSVEAREAILNAGNGLFLTGEKLESATNWVPVIIPTVPSTIRKEQGDVEVSSSMLADEIEPPHRTWMSFFSKAPRAGFQVFDESGIARPFKKQQPIEFCKRCNGHHPTKNCSREPSCGNYVSPNHLVDICMATTKCRNCGGPHRSDSLRCLARPTRLGTPTKEQMKTYRQAGEREFQAVLRARAAEEIAATTENSNIEISSSLCSEVNTNFENPKASPVDQSTGDAPHDPTAVQPLLNWTPSEKTVAIGDFNSVYWAWQPSASSFYGQGEEIQRWA
ncbi:putative eka-like protein [Erysiphe necator]|uniref:Putative eka-like protein n=1 Tax=Uncinula necator TaxID=52586 RepID=A0A0B1P9T7_UNCNE|nr:putative eka-like protein [Erysiphe necator]